MSWSKDKTGKYVWTPDEKGNPNKAGDNTTPLPSFSFNSGSGTDTSTYGVLVGFGLKDKDGKPLSLPPVQIAPYVVSLLKTNSKAYKNIQAAVKSATGKTINDPNTLASWVSRLAQNIAGSQDPLVKSASVEDFLRSTAAQAKSNTGYTGPVTYPSITNPEDAKATITKVFQSQLNRLPTAKEIADITKALNADEKKPGNVKTVTPVKNKEGQVISYQTTGGTNAEQFLTDYIQGNAALKKEADVILSQAPGTTDFQKNKKIFDDLITAAKARGASQAELDKIKQTTTYGQGLTEVENTIKNMARSASASNTPEELTKIAEDAYNQGLKTSSAAFQEFVNGQLSYQGAKPAVTPTVTPTITTTPVTGARTQVRGSAPTLGEDGTTEPTATTPVAPVAPVTPTEPTPVIGGPGGQTLTLLKAVALKNGVNLDDPKYTDQVAAWVKDIKAGADPEKYYAQIRSIAGEGKNNWIRKQLAAGQNLKDIYSTAINQVAGALGLDAESIDLNDPIFSKIFTEKGAVDNKTLAGILHSDPRWGGSTEQEKRDSEIKLNVQSLENAARANGVDLSTVFPDGVDALATSIVDKSSTLTKALQAIRAKAGEGKSKYVQEQLKSGRDLRDIYGSYINAMAKAFNVDADTIDINDALLQQAFSDKGATKLNDFQTLLEKDDRYIGTPGSIAQANTKEGALKQLNQVAKLNGIDLAAKYGTQVDQWVNDILKGKDINSIAQTIRNDAAADKPKYVKDQLALGNDLRDIYGNYINQMASALGIDANTIDVNDPLLANVFTDKGPINNVEFKNLLRTDPRYKTTTGAIGESQVLQAVKDAAVQIGATISDADAADIAAQAASKGLGTNSPEIAALIRSKIAYTPGGKVTGAAGTALQDLRNTAMANGMDLDKMFGTQVQDWLQKIAQGESPETYKKLIRETAQVGLPDTVKKLMSQGVDLSTVYSPYRNMMANVLEINPDTIDINDPTLRAAIGPDKEMSLYDWQRALRKDPRWQYTNNAKAEVSNAVQGVLKDFGFIG